MAEISVTQPVEKSTQYPGYNKRLLLMIALGNMALFAVYAAINGIFVPAMVQAADPVNKVANLGIVTGISAIFATVLNPLGGAWSDRTRTKWGRRTPWIVGASIATLLGSIFFGFQTTILGILVGWCLAQGMGNIFQAAITAVIPDRVPPEKRGTASAMAGQKEPDLLFGFFFKDTGNVCMPNQTDRGGKFPKVQPCETNVNYILPNRFARAAVS